MSKTLADVAIVGAGVAGLLAARELQAAGCHVVVLEKSRGLGGRMATRRCAGAVFDHGVQGFRALSSRFQAVVQRWEEAGIVVPWYTRGTNEEAVTFYRGKPAMNAIGKYLAQGLDVRRTSLVTAASRKDEHWCVRVEGDEDVQARLLLLTAPADQSRAILDAGGYRWPSELAPLLHGVSYSKMLTLLVLLDGPSGLPEPGVLEPAHGDPVAWVADNAMKGISPLPCLTIQSQAEFAQRAFDLPDEVRVPQLLRTVLPHLQSNVVRTQIHRWRYAFRREGIRGSFLSHMPSGLWFAGDAFINEHVEGAALSGVAAADSLATALKKA